MQSAVQEVLLSKFQDRRLRNASYSLRAFAETLGISSGALTGIVRGKRQISKKMAERLSVGLKLSEAERLRFLSDFESPKAPSHIASTKAKAEKTERRSLQVFELIAKWEYFAILSVLKIQNVKWTSAKIAKKLQLSPTTCEAMLEDLVGADLILQKGEHFFRSQKPLEFGDEVPNWAIKAFHAETLELARKSLYETAVQLRNHSSMTLAVNLKNLPKAEEKIRQFQIDMAELLETGAKSEIYRLNVQLFPMIQNHGDNNEK